MIIENLTDYIELFGIIVDPDNVEEQVDSPYVGRLSGGYEFLVEFDFDVASLCNDYNINIEDVSNIKLTLGGYYANVRRCYFCNIDREVLQSYKIDSQFELNLGYLKVNNLFENLLCFSFRSSDDDSYGEIEVISCEIITNYSNSFDNKPFYKTKLFNESIDNLISFQVDITSGRIDFSREIISLYGNKMPLHLSQSFNSFNSFSNFNYWKLNLQQKIYFANNKYYWIDGDFKTHEFEQISGSLYFDTSHTGLLLRIGPDEYVITNDIDKFYHFDAEMNLVSIESKRGEDSLSLQINKSSNTISFTDGMGRVATYLEVNNGYNLVLPDSTAISFIYNETNDIFTNLDGSQITFNYLTIGNIKLINSVVSTYGTSVEFTYDENLRIIKIEEFSNNLITKRILFEYFGHYIIISNINSPQGLLMTTRTGYMFSKSGYFISEIDLLSYENDEELNIHYHDQDSYEQFNLSIRSGESQKIQRVQGTNYFGINTTTLDVDEEYVIYAKLNCNALHLSPTNSLEINLVDTWPACYFVRQLFFVDYSFDGDLILATKIRPEDYTNEYIILEVVGNFAPLISNNTFHLAKSKKNSSFDIVKSLQNNGDFAERKANNTIYWNKLYSLVYSSKPDCGKITLNDYKINFYNLGRNNQIVLWYNDLSKAFLYNGNTNILINDNEEIEVSALKLGHLDININKKEFTYLEYGNENEFNFYKIINTNWNIEKGLIKQKKDCYGNLVYEEDSLGNIISYTLDNYGRAVSISKVTSLGTFKREKSFIYTSTEFKEIVVDEDGLIYEKTYDLLTGLLKSSKEPNGNYTHYLYDLNYRLINVSSSNNSNSISYNQDKISALSSSESNNFSFVYNAYKEIENVKIDDSYHLSRINIKSPNKESDKTLYANSKGKINIYNRFGKMVQSGSLTSLPSNGLISMNNIYGSIGGNYSSVTTYDFNDESISSLSVLRRTVFTDLTNPYSINYFYNSYGKLYAFEIPNNYNYTSSYSDSDLLIQEDFRVTIFNQNIYSSSYYTYANIDSINKSRLISYEFTIFDFTLLNEYTYDGASRISSKESTIILPSELGYLSIKYENTYKIRSENNITLLSNKLASRTITIEQDNFESSSSHVEEEIYTYNNNGLLESISSDDSLNRFTYDNLSRLIREDNEALNRSFTYIYNSGGNIVSKAEYIYSSGNLENPLNTINYGYNSLNHKDQLVSWNGFSFIYDEAGNPTRYKEFELARNNSNRLSKYKYDSSKYIDFEYNSEGVRREKVVVDSSLTIRHTYTYFGTRLLHEKITGSISENITFIYEKDEIIGFYLSDCIPYLYRKSILGDVIDIYDYLGEVVAKYAYDAWGNCEIIYQNDDNIGDLNPIRYRSYYYDDETGLYYLINRYYDPETGRFISPDSIEYLEYESINGVNFYCYCLNNPITEIDPLGNSFIGRLFIVITIALTLTLLKSDNNTRETPEKIEYKKAQEITLEINGKTIVCIIELTVDYEKRNKSKLRIIDSRKLTEDEIRELLVDLKFKYPYELNVFKIMNERKRHNIAYNLGIYKDASRTVDVYFNADDDGHWYSFILNRRLWY